MTDTHYMTNAYVIITFSALAMFSVLALCQLLICCCAPVKKSNDSSHDTYPVKRNCSNKPAKFDQIAPIFNCDFYYGPEMALVNTLTTDVVLQSTFTPPAHRDIKCDSPPPAYEDVPKFEFLPNAIIYV